VGRDKLKALVDKCTNSQICNCGKDTLYFNKLALFPENSS